MGLIVLLAIIKGEEYGKLQVFNGLLYTLSS